jgi:hypothetical protein
MRRLLAVLFLLPALAPAATGPEDIQYTVNWPSGLSLGEARLKATRAPAAGGEGWDFELTLDASVPGFRVADRFRSIATADFCSLEFEKDFSHGKRKNKERITFDQGKGEAVRETMGGGKSTLSIQGCARDALAFIFHLRKELSQGRLPAAQTIYYGAPYRIRLDYGGVQQLRLGDKAEPADRIVASVKGPASDVSFELFFAKDASRTLLTARVPLPLGSFTLEIVR